MTKARSRATAPRYAVGALATGTFGTVPGLLLLYYLTNTLGVPAALASAVVILPKAWDLVLHPWVGRRSDPWGPGRSSRRTWMKSGGVVLSVTFALLFMAPTPAGTPSALWAAIAFFCCATAYSAFQVPYLAALSEIAADAKERTRLATWRTMLYGSAILLSGALAPQLVFRFTDERLGYALVGVIFGGLLLAGTLAAAHSVPPPRKKTAAAHRPMTFRQQLAVARRSSAFRCLFGVHLAQTLATGIMLAAAQYFATYRLGDPAATTTLFACLILPLLLTAPLWQRLGHRMGPQRSLLASILCFVAGSLALAASPVLPAAATFGCVAVCGVGYAGMQTFAIALLGQTIAQDAEHTGGHNRGGAFTGLWTAGEVIGAGVGPALFSLVLAATGYLPSNGDATVAQPGSALTGVLLGVSVLPALVLVPALFCAWDLCRSAAPAPTARRVTGHPARRTSLR
ncbi:MFS transporter [Streptomyces sp. NPDC047123]|uniref:MFS transporter n=1 Tax=Streptomyces sp. NPDC047123 TaxID=3155622 RepID=UPI0033E3A680